MSTNPGCNPRRQWLNVVASLSAALLCSPARARAVEERHAADPQGHVEIVNVAGSVDLVGWDRPEIEVSGDVGDRVERVDVTTSGRSTSVHVVVQSGGSWGGSGEAHLAIRIPAKSAVSVSLVSASLKLSGIQGDVQLQTVSGDVSGDAGGDLHASTVSGDVGLAAHAANAIDIKTISGDITVSGGGGAVEITTVSGSAKVALDTLTRGRFKSVSGDMSVALTLAPDAQFDGDSISGSLRFEFAGLPNGEFDVQSITGSIENCFGPKPTESKYGPGSHLEFRNGDGHAHVRVETKSGDVRLCTKDLARKHAALASPAVPAAPAKLPVRCAAFPLLI